VTSSAGDGTALPPPLPADRPLGSESSVEPPVESLAMFHVTESSRTYPCGACGGELHFDITTQLLRCAHCGNTHELRENDGVVRENDLSTGVALARSGRLAATRQVQGEKEIVCQNCGGHTTFTGALTANRCPYCATPVQRDDVHDAPERIPVDGVLPFQVDQAAAKQLIEKWIDSRWFAPSEFKTYHRTGSFESVYMAYFTYDADTSTRYSGARGDEYTVTVGSGDNRRTETRVRWTPVSGVVDDTFDDLPVFANDGFERDRIAKLEPWPTHDAEPYSPEYVAGHLCRTYDHDVEACFPEARRTMEQAIDHHIRRDIGGDRQQVNSRSIRWMRTEYKHLLLPIWLLTVIYMDRPFQVYINGVTGEVHGQRPYSKVKIAVAVVAALVVLVTVAFLWSRARSG
jgi:DNA-directed RNA polymerase subunit RPC12/RpoP